MTVAELIAHLQTLPPDAPVHIRAEVTEDRVTFDGDSLCVWFDVSD